MLFICLLLHNASSHSLCSLLNSYCYAILESIKGSLKISVSLSPICITLQLYSTNTECSSESKYHHSRLSWIHLFIFSLMCHLHVTFTSCPMILSIVLILIVNPDVLCLSPSIRNPFGSMLLYSLPHYDTIRSSVALLRIMLTFCYWLDSFYPASSLPHIPSSNRMMW